MFRSRFLLSKRLLFWSRSKSSLTHVNSAGEARMVSVGDKKSTERRAIAQGVIKMNPSTIDAISDNSSKKGDVLAVARIAGIQGNWNLCGNDLLTGHILNIDKKDWLLLRIGGKMTSNLIPLCHNILIDQIKLDFKVEPDSIVIQATAKCYGKTGIGRFKIDRQNITTPYRHRIRRLLN